MESWIWWALFSVTIPVILMFLVGITVLAKHRYIVTPARRYLALLVGTGLLLYPICKILADPGIDLIAALIGTLGVAIILYGLGHDDMLNTIRGYFSWWKKRR